MELPKTATESDASPASELLDSILASGRTPDPTDSREVGAHTERIRRRLAETPPPPSAASGAAQANDGVAPPISDRESSWEGNKPDDSLTVVVLVALLAMIAGFLLGQLAALLGVIL